MFDKISALRWVAAAGFSMIAPFATAASPELMAVLLVMGYGYKVKVTINGADVGVEGGNHRIARPTRKSALATRQPLRPSGMRGPAPGSSIAACACSRGDPP